MSAGVKIFLVLGVFCAVVGGVYGYVTGLEDLAGFPALLALAVMSFMLAAYLALVQRSAGATLPEDREDGEIVEMAGDYGAFSPWSWWPLLLGIGCAIFVTALAVGWWIIGLAVPVIVIGLVGLIFEHSRGEHAH